MLIKKNIGTSCVLLAAMLQGCGERQTGEFLDSPVQGLQYFTQTLEGITDESGTFEYQPGETVVFSIGGLHFDAVPGQSTITPMELVGAQDIAAPEVVNILRLLQTLDEDQDPSNGIVIPESAHDSVLEPALGLSGDIAIEAVIADVIAQTYGTERKIVGAAAALDHFINTLSEQASDPEFPDTVDEAGAEQLFLIEQGANYQGLYLRLTEAEFEVNLSGDPVTGTATNRSGVYELMSGSDRHFFTPGIDENGLPVGCFGARPVAVVECEAAGRLFHVFTDLAATEEFGALAVAENSSGSDSLEAEPEFEAAQPGGETTEDTETIAINPLEPVELLPSTGTDAKQSENPVAEIELTLTTTTDCPTKALNAPVQFAVSAAAPKGCRWTPLSSTPVWTWSAGTRVDYSTNSVTDNEGGNHQGSFEHTCIDIASGRIVTVTASCEVAVNSASGPADITDLFFLTGQANASGVQTAFDPVLDDINQQVYAYTDSGWQVADLHQLWERNLPGNDSIDDPQRSPYNNVAFQVAKSLAGKSDRVVGIVVLTEPGAGISNWDYNSSFFVEIRNKAIEALNALPNKSSFDGILWLQGETDWLREGTADPGATGFADTNSVFYRDYYPNKLFQLVSNFRSEAWFGQAGKFICAETKKADLNPHLMALNSDDDAATGCAAAADLATRESDPFGNHFSSTSFRILGDRVADIYLRMVQ